MSHQTTEGGVQLQTAVRDVLEPITANPILDYVLIKDLSITGSLAISHGLQRPVQGWVITRLKTNSVIYEISSTDMYLTLAASAPAVVDVYIF
jgi:hypothetical protein